MNRAGRLEELLAALLRYGSWLASAAIGLGFALALIDAPTRITANRHGGNRAIYSASHPSGFADAAVFSFVIAIFVLRPIAGLVLAIILMGIVLGGPANSDARLACANSCGQFVRRQQFQEDRIDSRFFRSVAFS